MKSTNCQNASHHVSSSTFLGKSGGLSLDFATFVADLNINLSKLSWSCYITTAASRGMIGTSMGVSPKWHSKKALSDRWGGGYSFDHIQYAFGDHRFRSTNNVPVIDLYIYIGVNIKPGAVVLFDTNAKPS
jgi:hypothetical protein